MKMEAEHRLEQLKKATDRIQKEIEEVTEREHELRNVGSIKTISHDTVDSKVRRMPQALALGKLKRTASTPQILEGISLTPGTVPQQQGQQQEPEKQKREEEEQEEGREGSTERLKMTNGVISTTRSTATPLRFATAPSQKGLMHRFLASRGKIYKPKANGRNESALSTGNDQPLTPAMTAPPSITLNPLSLKAFNRSLDIQLEPDDEPKKPPARKGYVPVEEKIQKELNEMRERENELRLMRSRMLAKSQPNLIDIGNDTDSDIYDGSGSLRSGASSNTLNEDDVERENKGKRKPNPRRRSTLIAQWENLIAAKKDFNESNNESEANF